MKPLAMLFLVSLVSCASVKSDSSSTDAAAETSSDTAVDCSKVGCAPPPPCGQMCKEVCGCCVDPTCVDSGTTGTSISGSIDGKPVDPAIAALWIGAPDDPSTTVVYVFSTAVDCATISKAGWDARLPSGTQFFEVIAGDKVTGTYNVIAAGTPSKTEALVTFSYAGAAPTEKPGASGKVIVSNIDMSKIQGTFDVTVAGGALKGSFNAIYCATGTEP